MPGQAAANATTLNLESQALDVAANGQLEPGRFLKLAGKRDGQTLHFLGKGFAVVFQVGRADVAAGRKDVAVGGNFFD